jgi:hypothetical protein
MLASETFQDVLQLLRSIRTELTATGDTDEVLAVSRLTSQVEKWIVDAEQREKTFKPFKNYCAEFRAKHISPFLAACPIATGPVEDEYLDWLASRAPSGKPASDLAAELDDALEALDDAASESNGKAAINASKVIEPLARRLESRRLKSGEYVPLVDAGAAERELGERIIKVAFPLVTGRAVRLRADTGKSSPGGFVKIDGDYRDATEWFAICDAIQVASESSNVLAAVYNSSLSVPSRWAAARIRLFVDGELVPFSTDGFEWCAAFLDEREAQKIFVIKAAQTGYSTATFIKVIWYLDYCGLDCCYYISDDDSVKRLGIRLTNLIDASPYLAARIDQTSEAKQIGQATLHILNVHSKSSGRSTPASVTVKDEYDIMREEDTAEVDKRTAASKHPVEIVLSSPGYPGMGISGLTERWEAQKEIYAVDCPRCRESIGALTFPECFHRVGEYESDPRTAESYCKCSKCGERLDENKAPMVAGGRWQLANPEAQRIKNVRVFTGVNHLYSSTITSEAFAVSSLKVGEASVRSFHNDSLGLPWIEERGQVSFKALINSLSARHSMAAPKLPNGFQLSEAPRFMTVDQGRPHSAVVFSVHRRPRSPDDSNYLQCFVLKVLWAEKVHDKQRLDEISRMFGVHSAVVDADPDDTLPGYLLFGRERWLHHGCYVVAARALDRWDTAQGHDVKPDQDLESLSLVHFNRTQYYCRAIDRANGGGLSLPSDCPDQFISEMQNLVKTYTLDPNGQPRLYAKPKGNGKPHDYLTAMQLAELCLELHVQRKIGVRRAQPETITTY